MNGMKFCRSCCTQRTVEQYGSGKYCQLCTARITERRAKKDLPKCVKASKDKAHGHVIQMHLRNIGE